MPKEKCVRYANQSSTASMTGYCHYCIIVLLLCVGMWISLHLFSVYRRLKEDALKWLSKTMLMTDTKVNKNMVQAIFT